MEINASKFSFEKGNSQRNCNIPFPRAITIHFYKEGTVKIVGTEFSSLVGSDGSAILVRVQHPELNSLFFITSFLKVKGLPGHQLISVGLGK